MVLKLKGKAEGVQCRVALWHGTEAELKAERPDLGTLPDLRLWTRGGPLRWGEPIGVKGSLGKEEGPYVVDTISLPENNPWKSWIRCSGLDFFSDGRAAICSVSGDVWVVGGLDTRSARGKPSPQSRAVRSRASDQWRRQCPGARRSPVEQMAKSS